MRCRYDHCYIMLTTNQFISLDSTDMSYSSESSSKQTVAIVGSGLVCDLFN